MFFFGILFFTLRICGDAVLLSKSANLPDGKRKKLIIVFLIFGERANTSRMSLYGVNSLENIAWTHIRSGLF
ncbi:hypothetical protein Mettu_1956 [Methylobacter tundripaludum SV96]|uniref:Uncharacterized protein n=1 Tax=Methylobacter tundripaludum (strain ATCC BAA-1195 / DSM 17260 / SV96) TaxID=697282 RepID=G3IWQ7_METTV|nr:hypothetical protein Mettu_1956 [Methylobacter tundripaludum SV96]